VCRLSLSVRSALTPCLHTLSPHLIPTLCLPHLVSTLCRIRLVPALRPYALSKADKGAGGVYRASRATAPFTLPDYPTAPSPPRPLLSSPIIRLGRMINHASPPASSIPPVAFATPCAPQYTAETAGSKAHLK